MTTALWITLLTVTVVSALTLRLAVRLSAPKAENAWDNAFAYVGGTILLAALGLKAALPGLPWLVLLPPVLAIGQVLLLRWIYELGTGRAVLLGVVHTTLSALVLGTIALVTGAIAAYVLYGKIVSDPWMLLRILLKLIGVPLEADVLP